MRGTRRRLLTLTLAATLSLPLALAACGTPTDEEPSGAASADAAAFPATIEHKYGSTTVESAPSKVVALGLNDADSLLALGIKPVGVVDWFGERPYGNWPWAQPLWGDTEPAIVGERDDYNMEKIAELAPDLIVAQYSGMTEDQYNTLSELAPVVAQPKEYEDYAAPWKSMALPIAKAVGQEQKMTELIAAVDKRFEDARGQHPEFAEQTIAVVDPSEPGQFFYFASDDPKMEFMMLLGFKADETLESHREEGNNGFAMTSETANLLAVDRVVWMIWDDAAEGRVDDDPVIQELAVVKEGRDIKIDYNEPPIGAALSFNTVLSIPYAIDEVLPLLQPIG